MSFSDLRWLFSSALLLSLVGCSESNNPGSAPSPDGLSSAQYADKWHDYAAMLNGYPVECVVDLQPIANDASDEEWDEWFEKFEDENERREGLDCPSPMDLMYGFSIYAVGDEDEPAEEDWSRLVGDYEVSEDPDGKGAEVVREFNERHDCGWTLNGPPSDWETQSPRTASEPGPCTGG